MASFHPVHARSAVETVRVCILVRRREIASTTLTSKGQLNLGQLTLRTLNGDRSKPGDRLEVSTAGDRIIMTPATCDISDVCAALPRPKHIVTLECRTTSPRSRRTATERTSPTC